MDSFTGRATIFGTIIWTPAMQSGWAADHVAAMMQGIVLDNDCADFRAFARALETHGGKLILNIDHHGGQDSYHLMVMDGTWLSARISEITA